MRSWSAGRRLAVALAWALLGCAASPSRTTLERIGGETRSRSFASPTAYEAYLRAELALARGDHQTSQRQLELASLADPSDPYLVARLAEVQLLEGSLSQALETARGATERFPDAGAAWLALSEVQGARGDREAALAAARRALALDPGDPDARAASVTAAGGLPSQASRAGAEAPGAQARDRVLASRLALDPSGEHRRVARSRVRALAQELWDRGAWGAVDRALTPLVERDPSNVADRVRVIEARARDGRPGDAARLLPGVPVAEGERGGLSRGEVARLWLLAGRADVAREEAWRALSERPEDVLAERVLGEARVAQGAFAEGIVLLARVPEGSEQYVDARLAIARGLALSGHPDLADVTLERAASRLPGDPAGRDRLRVARAEGLLSSGAPGEARVVLAAVETPWGLHRRGALVALTEAPEAVLRDLRVRSGDGREDAEADGWVVLVCRQHPDACGQGEARRALEQATRGAPEAAITLRARAALGDDRREAAALLRRAQEHDPLSPWTSVLLRQLGASGEHPRTP